MIDKKNIQNIYELTPMQNTMLFSSLYDDNGAFFEQISFDINNAIDVDIFHKAWNKIVDRHDVLKSNFIHTNVNEPIQIVLKKREVGFFYEDLSSEKSTQDEKIAHYKQQDKDKGFDLSKDTLFKVSIFKNSSDSFHVIISFHHILMDGWCSIILYEEFKELYFSLLNNRYAKLASLTPYVDYVKWLRASNEDEQKKFWSIYLADYKELATLPNKKISEKRLVREFSFNFSIELTTMLVALAKDLKVTLSNLLQTIWAILLSKYSNTNDVVFGTIVSGRPTEIANIETMIGLFMNTIAIRIKYDEQTTFDELVKSVQKQQFEFGLNQYYPLAKIQALSPLKNSLLDHSFVFENYPSFEDESDENSLDISNYSMDDSNSDDFTIQVIPGEEIYFKLIYNNEVYDQKIIENIEKDLIGIAKEIAVKDGNVIVDDIAKELMLTHKKERIKTVVSATFTTDNIEDNLLWWAKKFDIKLELSFSSYNQVFQELLDKDSKSSQNSDVNIFLVRFEDFVRNKNLTNSAAIEKIQDSYDSLIDILRNRNQKSTDFFGVYPVSSHLGLSSEVTSFIDKLNERYIDDLKSIKNLFSIDFRKLDSYYQVGEIFDLDKDKSGHLPFSDEYYSSYATEIFRNLYIFKKQHFKVIALDCDNTLWGGIVGEDGVNGIIIDDGYKKFQEFLVRKHDEGFLLVLNSKNNEADVDEVFEKNSNMVLKKEHIVSSRVNWSAKSENLKELADELNLGLNSFIFLDDNGVECSEVMKNRPEVLTLQVPKNSKYLENFVSHIWALDKLKITDEDKKRSKMYRADKGRKSSESSALSMDEFLASLELEIYMHQMDEQELARVSQLTQRTNQFNVSTIRRGENEILELIKDKSFKIWSVYVQDKFGEYGLVSVIITKENSSNSTLFVDTFLMSCRVLGRGVEKSILHALKNYSHKLGFDTLSIDYYPTKKNAPALNFIKESGFTLLDESDTNNRYKISVNALPKKVEFVKFHFEKIKKLKQMQAHEEKTNKAQNSSTSKIPQKDIEDIEWHLSVENEENLTHLKFYIPMQNYKAKNILQLTNETKHRDKSVDYVSPSTEVEKKLVEIFEDVLQRDNVGIKDDFFILGGHSLKATILLSKINREFTKDISLKEIFIHSSVEKLSKLVLNDSIAIVDNIKKVDKQLFYELSSGQKRVWVLSQFERATLAYNMPIALSISGELNIKILEKSVNLLIKKYEVLRTRFVVIDDEPMQEIVKKLKIKIKLEDFTDKENLIQNRIKDEANEEFDLEKAPLFRVKVLKTGNKKYILLFTMHHIISDGWSLSIVMSQLNKFYNSLLAKEEVEKEELPFHYKDYSAWQNEYLNSQKATKMQKFYLEKFDKFKIFDFPTDFARPNQKSFDGNTVSSQFNKDKFKKIDKLIKSKNMSLFMFLNALIKIFLYKYTKQSDITIGSVVAGRNVQLEEQIGFFVNSIALRDNVDSNCSVDDFLEKIKNSTLDVLDNALYPFDKLVEDLSINKIIKKDVSRSPIFDILVVLQNYDDTEFGFNELKVENFESEFNSAQFDMTFTFTQHGQMLGLNINYNTSIFKIETINYFLESLDTILDDILTKSDKEIKDVKYLSLSQKNKLLQTDTKDRKFKDKNLTQLFKEKVNESPNSIAVIFNDKKLSYKELDELSNSFAHNIQIKYNLQIGDKVAILLDSYNAIIATFALVKLGVVYIPIDKNYPKNRIEYILDNSGAKILIYQTEYENSILDINVVKEEYKEYKSVSEINFNINLEQLLYIIYTSGTTGKPKGVMVGQSSFINLLEWYIETFEIDETSKVLLMIPFVFDASMKNIFAPLISGATVVLSNTNHYNPQELSSLIKEHSVSLINSVPSAFKPVMDASKKDNFSSLSSLKYLALGGEALDVKLFSNWLKDSNTVLYNIYGPTEATDITTFKRVDLDEEQVTIGKPIPNSKVYILDDKLEIVPNLVTAEIYIGGSGLAKGYVNNQQLTDEKFIDNPYKDGELLYRSGDRARYLSNGDIQYLGRNDEQIKIRGYRVELLECENSLLAHVSVLQAVVIAKEFNSHVELFAYVVLGNELVTEVEIKNYMSSYLLDYMIPKFIIILDELPLNINGKIDKLKLPMPKVEKLKVSKKGKSKINIKLLSIWQDVLGAKNIDESDDFFEIGGYSLKAIELHSKLEKEFDGSINLLDIFKFSTITSQEELLKNSETKHKHTKNSSVKIVIFPNLLETTLKSSVNEYILSILKGYDTYSFEFFKSDNIIKEYANLLSKNMSSIEYIFIGYSSGGNLAFEVAKLMLKRGHNVTNLILIDSWKAQKKNFLKENDKEEIFKYIKDNSSNFVKNDKKLIKNHIDLINNMIHRKKKLKLNIDIIKSNNSKMPNSKANQDWKLNCKRFTSHDGFGTHYEMFSKKYVENNLMLIQKIIKKIVVEES